MSLIEKGKEWWKNQTSRSNSEVWEGYRVQDGSIMPVRQGSPGAGLYEKFPWLQELGLIFLKSVFYQLAHGTKL